MKIKIIDLLNMISKGKEVPKKIRYKGEYWYLKQNYANRLPYYSNGYDKDNLFTGEEEDYFSHSLNDEIEVIEEEDKKIEKIDNAYYHETQDRQNEIFKNKINEIIDYLNKGD